MIDLDQLDRQLEEATTGEVRVLRGVPAAVNTPAVATPTVPAWPSIDQLPKLPSPPPPPAAAPVPRRAQPHRPLVARSRPAHLSAPPVVALAGGSLGPVADALVAGRFGDAFEAVAAHARRTRDSGDIGQRRDGAGWSTMTALFEGRGPDARAGLALVLALGEEAAAPDARDRWWIQRFWVALEWGTEADWYELLDHCREQAYRFDDARWWSMLSLLLARMGLSEEATRALDTATGRCLGDGRRDADWLDSATNLAESAALLGTAAHAEQVYRALAGVAETAVVLVGPAWVCKGSVARFQGLAAAMSGRPAQADEAFATAVACHRAVGAGPLLARTLHEWGRAQKGRNDMSSAAHLGEGGGLAARFGLVWA